MIQQRLDKRGIDQIASHFILNLIRYGVLTFAIFTIITQLKIVEVTSIAALIASAGVGISLAMQGALSNFAGGILLLVIRPFKKGDYIGNKYRIIAQIQKWFPNDIDTMLDLFCGGCDVSINTPAQKHIANDINLYLIQILDQFKSLGAEKTLEYIYATIEDRHLSKDNEQAYISFRNDYNASDVKNSLDLYVLMCYSFNYQFRFNSAHQYNNPFGRARSSFNDVMRDNLVAMIKRLDNIEFSSTDFLKYDYSFLKAGDFVYADPPYLITCGSYNDGKRGFRGWGADDEVALYDLLDELDSKGVKFALSNVLSTDDKTNIILQDWLNNRKYNCHHLDFSYKNSNYHKKHIAKTDEVLITNY